MIKNRDELPKLPDGWRWVQMLVYGRWVAANSVPVENTTGVYVSELGVEITHRDGRIPKPVPLSVIKADAIANGVTF